MSPSAGEKPKIGSSPAESRASAALIQQATAGNNGDPMKFTLHQAAKHADLVTLQAHIATGADVNACDDLGIPPLYWAAFNGNAEVFQVLLTAGADPLVATRLRSYPIHIAAEQGRIAIVQKLVELGVSLTLRDYNGQTPEQIALKNQQYELLRWIKDAAALEMSPLPRKTPKPNGDRP